MTKGKKLTTGGGRLRTLKIKKETIRDLDSKGKAGQVKGGATQVVGQVCGPTSYTCATKCGVVSCLAVCGVGGLHG